MKFKPLRYRSIAVTTHLPANLAIGRDARDKRVRLGISLRRTARQIGISAPHLGELELGRANWSSRTVDRFNAALIEIVRQKEKKKR